MANIYKGTLGLVGNTPLVEVVNLEKELGLGRPYYQVFRDAMGGFTPRLSGLDLLLNEGPGSLLFLKTILK